MIGEILQTLIKEFLHLFQEKHFSNISQLRLGKNMSRASICMPLFVDFNTS